MLIASVLALVFVSSAHAAACPKDVPASEQAAILNAHNKLRDSISKGQFVAKGFKMPAAKTSIPALKWDCDLASSAQQWANKCVFKHSEQAGVGENLYTKWSSAKLDFNGRGAEASASWAEEFQLGWRSPKFTMDTFNAGMGHATQMAWAKSTKIGCGYSSCDGGKRVIVVCQYKDRGNMLNQNIYEAK